MTIDEQDALSRIEAKLDGVDRRLGQVETSVAVLVAVDTERVRTAHERGNTQRWLVGLAITTGASVAGLCVAVFAR